MANNLPIVSNSRWFAQVVGEDVMAAAANLSPQVVETARERGRERDIWESAAELLEEFSVRTYEPEASVVSAS